MQANKLVVAAMLAGAGVASIGTLAQDKGAMHKMTPAKTPLSVEGELASLGRATAWPCALCRFQKSKPGLCRAARPNPARSGRSAGCAHQIPPR